MTDLPVPRDASGEDASPQALRAQLATLARERDQARAAMSALERDARQWAMHSRYKSEFLANMSHELRTPLNSLLILAQLLAENAAGNLTAKQVEYAQTIRVSGNELLALIDDVLDLSKVESGTATLSIDWVSLPDVRNYLEHIFREVARVRGLAFSIAIDEQLPDAIRTDRKRLQQVLQNLLANACKFTARGAVSLRVSIAAGGWTPGNPDLEGAASVIAFAVVDSGIGVAQDKQALIFEAFRQADGGANRAFEGTGLGLSISAELARLLGGEIRVDSSPGEGSTFTLYLPVAQGPGSAAAPALAAKAAGDEAPDDRQRIRPGDRVVLNVAQDSQLAAMLLRQVRALGFKALSAANTHSALALAHEYLPNVVTVGVRARDMSGWAGVNLLRKDLLTRHIPMNVVAIDEPARLFTCLGSLGIVIRPSRDESLREAMRRLVGFQRREPVAMLVAAASKAQRRSLRAIAEAPGRRIACVATGKRALALLQRSVVDCTVIGQGLADMAPQELVRHIFQAEGVGPAPLIVCTLAGQPGADQPGEADAFAEILLLKRLASTDAVLDEVTLCMHEALQDMPPGQHRLHSGTRPPVPALVGRKALIVDDDQRSAFALCGALERQGMVVLSAPDGPTALALLERHDDIDIVLMDMMMPGRDGYQTIREVRRMEHIRGVPIIAVTARAMKGDREACLAAGASDYVAKPVNVEQLLAVVGVWLAPAGAGPPAQMRTSPVWMA